MNEDEQELIEDLYWWLDDVEATSMSLTTSQVQTLLYAIDRLTRTVEDLGKENLAQIIEIGNLKSQLSKENKR